MPGSYISPPLGLVSLRPAGRGPFVTRERFHAPDGQVVEWTSWEHRKQAVPVH